MSQPRWGVVVAASAVLGHVIANLAHGWAHDALGVEPPPGWMPFIVGVILVGPILGLAIAPRWRIPGAFVIGSSMLASLAFGLAWHYVIDSPDRCDHVPPGPWSTAFHVTSAMLVVTEIGGVVGAVAIARDAIGELGAGATRAVILVDGTCVFCNRLARWILDRDRAGFFELAHIQGPLGRAVLARRGIDPPDVDGVYVVVDPGTPRERLLIDGEAGRLIYPRVLGLAGIGPHLVPLPILDLVYRGFARVRYRLFGQSEQCIVPSPEERARFVEA